MRTTRRRFSQGLLAVAMQGEQAISMRASSAADTNEFPAVRYVRGYYDLSGRTQVHPISALTTAVIISWGQSLGGNNCYTGAGYTVTQAQNHNFCFLNGGVYQTLPRMLGCGDTFTGDNYLARLADSIISGASKQRVIICPMGADGSGITDWAVGGELNARIGVMARRLASVGLTATHLLSDIGETDAFAGGSTASFVAAYNSALSTFRAAGVNCTAYVGRCTWIGGSLPVPGSANVRTAVDQIVNGTTVKYGADTDGLNNTFRADGTHWNNGTGAGAAAALWKTALGL